MKEFLQRTVAALMVAVYSLSVAPASELALTYQAGRKTLDAYLERAEVQSDREKFEKIAEQGIGAAIAEWEQNSLELKISDYDEWLLQKDALQEDLQNYKDLSFEAWTQKRQTEEKAAMQKTALYDELRKAALEFSFEKADGTTTRIVSQEFIGEAKKQWSEIADGIVQRYIDEWFSENGDVEFLRNEFLSLETSITNSLVNALLYDHASLKKLSDAEAAAVIAQQLADDIDAQTTDSMNRLFDSMQTQVESVDENAASGGNEKEWLSRFEKELEAGLAKWDEAERSFLNARVEWEQNAENIFINDNQKWMEAYNELEKRKSQWVEKIEEQIEEGKKKWQAKFTNLQNEIDEYMDELQNKLALEIQQKEELVDAGISTYNQCRDILAMAQGGITNWYARWTEKYNGLYSYWKTEDNSDKKIGNVYNLTKIASETLEKEFDTWKENFVKVAKDIAKKYNDETEEKYNSYTVLEYSEIPEDVKQKSKAEKEQLKKEYEKAQELLEEVEEYSATSSDEKIIELSKKIASEKTTIISNCPNLSENITDSVWECFVAFEKIWQSRQELFEWFDFYNKYTIQAKISFSKIYEITGGGIKDYEYDEIENEQIKLSALESYWQSREEVASAVYEYSENFSSSLEEAAATKNNLEARQKEYEAKNNEYIEKLNTLSSLQAEIDTAKEHYIRALEDTDGALANIEKERQLYDELYEQWLILNEDKTFEKLLSLNMELESNEISDTDFWQLIVNYYNFLQSEPRKKLAEENETVKALFTNGKEESNISGGITKELLNEYDIALPKNENGEDISNNLFYEGTAPQFFSTSRIDSLATELETIIKMQELSISSIDKIKPELEAFNITDSQTLNDELKTYSSLEKELANLDINFNNKTITEESYNSQSQELKTKLSDSLKNLRACLETSLEHCNSETKRREAITVLFDKDLEEINTYFSENTDMNDVYEKYEDKSPALLKEKQKTIMASISNIIKNNSRENIYEFIASLDAASTGLDEAGKAIFDLYKKNLLEEKSANEKNIENVLMSNINDTFKEQNLIIRTKNFHIGMYESFFATEDISNCKAETNGKNCNYVLLDTIEKRNKTLSQMQDIYTNSVDIQLAIQNLNEKMAGKQKDIENAQDNYEEKVEKLRGPSESSAVNLYISACNKYNSALTEAQDLYNQLENARRKYRVAEEVYFYAQNEYLHGESSIKEKLKDDLIYAREKLSKVQTALEVLSEIKAERTGKTFSCKEFDNYKESAKNYYKARVLYYEYNQELIAQEVRVAQAQKAEQAALDMLVCEWEKNQSGNTFTLPAIASDFVTATKTESGYSFKLNSLERINSISENEKSQSDTVLTEYYSNYCICTNDVYGNANYSSLAKNDAQNFLCSLENKNYTIEDLALAFLYLKMQGNDKQKKRWLKSDENPDISENYPVGDIPEKMHSVKLWDAYKEGRKIALEEAYNKVIENGGEQDIVNYILFSETNISSSLELYQREHDTLSIRGFDNVVNKIENTIIGLVALAAVQAVLVATYTAITLIPFGFGSWAAALLSAAIVVLVSLTGAAAKLSDVKDDVLEIQQGYEECSEIYQNSQKTYFNAWQDAIKKRKAEEERLNIIRYGKPNNDGSEISWKNFDIALKEVFEGDESIVEYSYFRDLHNSGSSSKNINDLFYEAVNKNKSENGMGFTNIGDAINIMNKIIELDYNEKYLELGIYISNENEKKITASNNFYSLIQSDSVEKNYKNNLKTAGTIAWGNDSFNKTQFNKEMLALFGEEILPTLPVRLGYKTETCTLCGTESKCACNSTEDYIEEIFNQMKAIYISQIYDKSQAEKSIKNNFFSILKTDLKEQSYAWYEKITFAENIGIEEWYKADEKLNVAYNSWQKEWLEEYDKKNEEWDSNYTNFLQDKQNWINQSYLQTGVQDVQIKNYAAISQIKCATNIESTINDYVSSLYDADKFLQLADLSNTLLTFFDKEEFSLGLLAFDNVNSSILKDYDEMVAMQTEIESDMKHVAAKYQASQMQMKFEEDLKNYFASIEQRNKDTESWELDMVRKVGYTVDSEIHRDAIIDSMAFSTIREKQTVHRYEYFTAQAPEISFNIENYQGSSDYFIMKKMEELGTKIQNWQEEIFGTNDENGNEKEKGELRKHIGESPTFIENIDLEKSREENIKDHGSGEMGLIMLDFQWNSLKNKQGYAELAKPIYDQKLIKSDGGFQLPTIRDIFSMVCDILGNSGMAFLKYLDDIVFGMLDVGMGYKSFEEVMNEGLKQGLISAASYGVSAAGSAIFSSVGEKIGSAAGSQILAATQKAAVGLATNVTSSYINAFDFTTGQMNWEQANSVWHNASTFTSIAGTMLGGALGEINNVDANGLRLNQGVFKNIANMNNTIGNLSTAALNYAFTGDISFNLASVNGVGLFEVGFKDGKFGAGISEGGTSFSLFDANLQQVRGDDGKMHLKASLNDNVLKTFVDGAKNAKQVAELKNSGEIGKTTLNTANQISYIAGKEGLDLAKDLFNGNKTLYFDDSLGGNGENSLINMENEKTIGLSSSLFTGTKEDQALIDGLIAMNLIQNRPEQVAKEGEEIKTEKMQTVDKLTEISSAYSLASKMLNTNYSENEDAQRLKAYAESFDNDGKAGVASVYAGELEEKAKQEAEEKKQRELEEALKAEYEAKRIAFEAQNKIVITEQEVMEIARNDIAKKANAAENKTNNNDGTVSLGFTTEANWGQNYGDYNTKELLGDGLTKNDYNDLAKENAADRYAEKEYANPENTLSKTELKQKALNDNSLFDGKYKPQNYDSSIANVGCKLTTITYLLFNATDILITPAEANKILKDNNIFEDSNGYQDGKNNGINEKNELSTDSYALAINILAKTKNINITEDIIKFESSTSDTKKMFDKIIEASNSKDIYYSHMRVNNNGHSVLFRNLNQIDYENIGNSQVNVLNPYSNERNPYLSQKSYKLREIDRADFFKLTAAGKEIYNKLRGISS